MFFMIKEPIKKAIKILKNPEKEFEDINKRTFESIFWDYIKLIVFAAAAAGIFSFLFAVAKAAYFDIFIDIDVQYWRMINYSFGRAISLAFFYVFAGSFLLFFLSVLLKPFFRSIKYTRLLEILFYSLSPFLLFGWIAIAQFPMAVWSIFLFMTGIKSSKSIAVRKGSIQQRE